MNRPARAGLAVAAVSALGASFLLGVVVAGGAGTTVAPPIGSNPTLPPGQQPFRLASAELEVAESCAELLEAYVERGVDRVGPYGWDYPYVTAMEGAEVDAGTAVQPQAAPGAARADEATSSATGTNVQEAGVDEADVVKTDGDLLVRVTDGDLEVHDVTGSEPVELSDTDLPGSGPTELLLADDRVVALTSEVGDLGRESTRMVVLDLSSPEAPVVVEHREYDAALVRAVQHDDTVRLVLSAGLPDLDFVQPRLWRDDQGALETNRDVVRKSRITDWLPRETTYDGSGEKTGSAPLLACEQVAVPADDRSLGTMAVVGFDVDDADGRPSAQQRFGLVSSTDLAYFSPTRMYLASAPADIWGCCWGGPVDASRPMAEAGRTRLHAFALDGTETTYTASGVVDGVVADRWSMDEHDGVLRVAVGQSMETGNFNSVVTLREAGDDLEEIGRVDRLGVDEEIKAVRWFDSLAIVVTFRQVDPLYAVDLSDPADPELLGELKIPGFSEYLHPIAGQRLIGLGQDATLRGMVRGAQAALFDVSDLTDPRQTDLVRYPKGTMAQAGLDPRQFTWLPDAGTALTVVSQGWEGRTGWVSVLEVAGDGLTNRMVEVEHGSDVADVRLVPLPDGRVVLVTEDGVSFFEV